MLDSKNFTPSQRAALADLNSLGTVAEVQDVDNRVLCVKVWLAGGDSRIARYGSISVKGNVKLSG